MAVLAYNSVPLATQTISETQSLIKTNFDNIKTYLETDHVPFANANSGKHNQVTMPVMGSDPGSSAGEIRVYSKTGSTSMVPELYFQRNNAAAVVNMTEALASFNGYTYLPSGIIMQWGVANQASTAAGNIAITFPITFPNNCFNVQITSQENTSGSDTNGFVRLVTFSTTGATAYASARLTSGGNTGAIYSARWLAIGN